MLNSGNNPNGARHNPMPRDSHFLRLVRIAFWVAFLGSLYFAIVPLPAYPGGPSDPSDKFLHILAFTVLSGLARIAFPETSLWRIGAWLSAYGAIIEIIQAIPALHRDSDVMDWVADTLSVAVTLTVLRLVFRRSRLV